jgi:hypothetical protein
MTYTARDIEGAKDFLLTGGIGYWAQEATVLEDGSLRVVEDDEDMPIVATISPTDLLNWLTGEDGPRRLIAATEDIYQKCALLGLMALDWPEADYDADTSDLVIQTLAFGEIRYS